MQTAARARVDRGGKLPGGVKLVTLNRHSDSRGSLVELYRQEWQGQGDRTVQWNHVVSKANVLRGVHVHHTHWDYLYMAQGNMELALVDVRRDSVDFRRPQVILLEAENPCGVIIPPGVAHGFYFADPAILVYGVSHYWNPEDELGCRWDDPELHIPWQLSDPLLSQRDRTAGTFENMVKAYEHCAEGNALN